VFSADTVDATSLYESNATESTDADTGTTPSLATEPTTTDAATPLLMELAKNGEVSIFKTPFRSTNVYP
jgi:hypothetical protein